MAALWLLFPPEESAEGVQKRFPRVVAVLQQARRHEAKPCVYRVLAAVVSERAPGLLLFRTHFLILVT